MTKICDIDWTILTGEKSLYAHNKIHLHEEYKCKFYMKVFKQKNLEMNTRTLFIQRRNSNVMNVMKSSLENTL